MSEGHQWKGRVPIPNIGERGQFKDFCEGVA